MKSPMKRLATTKTLRRAIFGAAIALMLGLTSCGGGSDAPPQPQVRLLAGSFGGAGNFDGTGAAARFYFPQGVAADAAGNVYVADTVSSTIRKLAPNGVVTTLAGVSGSRGSADGVALAARFYRPGGVAVDAGGNVFVADSYNNAIRKITSSGVVSTFAGTAGVSSGSTDGTGSAARFSRPNGVAVDVNGNVFVADYNNHTIRKITSAGVVSTFAGAAGVRGSTDGAGDVARFSSPANVAVDAGGNVLVADYGNHTIRKITSSGVVSTLAGTAGNAGDVDDAGAAARFSRPYGIAVDTGGNVFVGDYNNHKIRKITPAGVVSTLAGSAAGYGSTDGTGAAAKFSYPTGVSVDGAGNVFVADYYNNIIRKITPAGVVSTPAGSAGNVGGVDGTGTAASFAYPNALAVGANGTIFVTDSDNATIRKVTTAGVVSTFAGTAGNYGSVDGTGAAANFSYPVGVTVDANGNVYVADFSDYTIRKITSAGVVSTFAGTANNYGSADGVGAAAAFNLPLGVAVDTSGNVYVADAGNGTIRKITPAGVVSTMAGTAGTFGSADGIGAAAKFNFVSALAIDAAGNLYVADSGNNNIRKITPAGVVSTLAGTLGVRGNVDGVGTAASFSLPNGLAVDGSGNVFVADYYNNSIRKITPAGVVSTYVGPGATATIQTTSVSLPASVGISSKGLVILAGNAVLTLEP